MSQPSTTSENVTGEPPNQRISGLIAAGKCRQAVEAAKEHHKRARTPESERLLVEAYVARIGQQLCRGSVEDAQTLMNVVRERFPAHRERLAPLEIQTLAALGKFDALVGPLAQPNLSPAVREAIENAVRTNVFDLPRLVGSKVLAPEHPFRTAATLAWRAFVAVTSGPVTDEQIALPEISRRSPFAPWKLLIRAIALYYRNDDEGCRRALEAVPRDAAIRPLADLLMGIVNNAAPTPGAAAAAALRAKISLTGTPVRDLVRRLDEELWCATR